MTIKKVLASVEFSKMYNLCETKGDSVILYDGTENFLDCTQIELYSPCSKVIKIKKIDFSLNSQSLMDAYRAGIQRLILDKYDIRKGKSRFQFVNMLNLQTFTLICNREGDEISLVSESVIDF